MEEKRRAEIVFEALVGNDKMKADYLVKGLRAMGLDVNNDDKNIKRIKESFQEKGLGIDDFLEIFNDLKNQKQTICEILRMEVNNLFRKNGEISNNELLNILEWDDTNFAVFGKECINEITHYNTRKLNEDILMEALINFK